MMGLDYFVENMQAFLYAWNLLDRRTKPNFPNCPATWVVLSLWPILALCGLIIQGKFTGKGDHHKRSKLFVLTDDIMFCFILRMLLLSREKETFR